MARRIISREKIINAFLWTAFEKSSDSTSLQDIATALQVKKASLYNHFSSKDDMYQATVLYCGDFLSFVNFIPDDLRNSGKLYSTEIAPFFKKIIKRYFQLFESEPLIQIYTFLQTEKYFNKDVLLIIQKETEKIEKNIEELVQGFIKHEKLEKLQTSDIKNFSKNLTTVILKQLDFYIIQKKQTIRENPESGAGSLFALPTDESAISKILKQIEWLVGKA